MISGGTSPVAICQKRNAGRTKPGISSGKRVYTMSCAQQISPGRKENGAGRHRHPFIPQCLQKRQRESSTRRFSSNNYAVGRIALSQEKPVGGAGVQKAGGKQVFRGKAVFRK